MFANAVDFMVEQQSGNAEDQAENGHATQRDGHAYHAGPADGLEDKEAEDSVSEVEKVYDIVRRREVTPMRSHQRRALAYLGEDECRQADQASPDHPAHTLIILRRLAPSPHQ